MPWTSDFSSDGATIRYHGRLTGAEILQAKADFFAHAFTTGARFVLCDFSAVADFDVTPHDVQRIIDQDRRAVSIHPKLAEVVVAPEPLSFGMSRMWEEQIEDTRPRVAVKKSRVEAMAWLAELGISPRP